MWGSAPASAAVAGVAAGLLSGSALWAGPIAAVAWLLAHFLAPVGFLAQLTLVPPQPSAGAGVLVIASVLVAGAVAVAVVFLRSRLSLRMIAGATIGVIVVSMWAGTFAIVSQPKTYNGAVIVPSTLRQLDGDVPGSGRQSDQYVYIRTIQSLREGTPYYRAFVDAGRQAYGADKPWPSQVFNVRMPAGYVLFAAAGNATVLTAAFLLLVTGLIVFAVAESWRWVHPAAALLPAVALAAYGMAAPSRVELVQVDVWAGVLLAAALLAEIVSRTRARWWAWSAGAAVLATIAAVMRETAVVFLVAAWLAALASVPEQRLRRLAVWSAGLLVFGAAFAVHAAKVRPLLVEGAAVGGLVRGGLDYAVLAFRYGSFYLGQTNLVPIALALLGLLALVELPGRGSRLLAALAIGLPVAVFMLVANEAVSAISAVRVNYWGALIVPSVYAVTPFAIALVPGARAPARWRRTEGVAERVA